MAFAYLDPDGVWSFREDFPCTILGDDSWAGHPWTITDPSLPTYQDCPRCGARRIRVPSALASVARKGAGPTPGSDPRGI